MRPGSTNPTTSPWRARLALLARHIIKDYPEYYGYFALKEFHYRKHKFINRNPLIGLVAGVDGLKTGFIKESGYGIVASAKQEGRRLIAVVNGCNTAEERRDEARRLLEWGFKNFSEAKLFDAGEVIGHARVWGGERMYVPLAGNGEINIWLARQPANPKLRAQIIYNGPLKPPLRKGEQVARLRVTTPSEATNEVPLYVAEDVGRAGVMRRGLDTLLIFGYPLDPLIGLLARRQREATPPRPRAPDAQRDEIGKVHHFRGRRRLGKSTQAKLLVAAWPSGASTSSLRASLEARRWPNG